MMVYAKLELSHSAPEISTGMSKLFILGERSIQREKWKSQRLPKFIANMETLKVAASPSLYC